MIYLDNAATTNFKPQEVLDAYTDCVKNFSFNANRSGHPQAMELLQKTFAARKKIAAFCGAEDASRVVFTTGCTFALNTAILGTAKRGGHVICSVTEHNSVLRPLFELKERKIIDITLIEPDKKNGLVSVAAIKREIRPNTYMVALSYVSNVTGQKQNVAEIGNFLRQYPIVFLVDAAQAAGYLPLELDADGIDCLALGAHKGMHGLAGAGALVLSGKCTPSPLVFGGTGSDTFNLLQPTYLPDAFEAGTQNTAAILAFAEAADYCIKTQKANVSAIMLLSEILHENLPRIKGVKLFSRPNESGIAAFEVENLDSAAVADRLAQEFDIAVRGGLHCAPLMHKWLETAETGGLVRVSLSAENTKADCYALLSAAEKIAGGKK